ncbi:Retrovirus-related Pol polyprotein from transposon, partial [Trichinella nativa]
LEGDAEWKWTEDCQVTFDALKHQLTSAPILAYPVFRRRFLVDVDASGDGLGAVLSQKDGSKERFVAYASRSLTKPECRYCVTRREMLRLVWALREFRPSFYVARATGSSVVKESSRVGLCGRTSTRTSSWQ